MAAHAKRSIYWLVLLLVTCLLATAVPRLALAYDHPRDHGHQHRCDPPPGSGLPATPDHP